MAVALLVVPGRLAPGRPARVAFAGLAALAAWTLASAAWAPVVGTALEAAQLPLLYLGALLAAALLLQDHRGRRWVEPAVAAGVLVVVGYGLSERLLPGLLAFDRSATAQGRLEQPLTYWNAMGLLAALGLVLVARICGDARRGGPLRTAAAAAAAPLGMALWLTVSRGALLAAVAGALTLVVAAASTGQARAAVQVAVTAALAAAAAAPFDGVTAFAGTLAQREREGAVALVLLALVAAAGALAQRRLAHRADGRLPLPRQAPALTFAAVAAVFVLAVAVGGTERSTGPLTPGAPRLVTFTSNRYAYWDVAVATFADHPLRGVGAAGWAVEWRKRRDVREGAGDAHSLYLQTAAELGVVGLLLLAAVLGGIAAAAADALRRAPQAAVGAVAGLATWAVHAGLDWDFQMPAVTLPAVVLAGSVLALTALPRSAAPRDGTPTPPGRT